MSIRDRSVVAAGQWLLVAGRAVRAVVPARWAIDALHTNASGVPAQARRSRRVVMRGQPSGASSQWRIPGLLGLVVFALPSCQITDHSERDPSAVTAEALNIPASGFAEGDTADLPRLAFDSTEKHFGKVTQGTLVEKSWTFTNVGGSDLVITDVRGTCGCTVGKDWPKAPVRPGEGGTITVTFDSEGRSGMQDKTITVTGNTQPPTTVLMLKGEVVAPPTN